ncbi:uncharacterized protein DUF2799 [Alteromonadaceae bacterium 2753L.S.0a.02]|nr:uncharacterized protein DUF2799 [Alteromonadaceae bacterium 2753L.S.0a.02]
MRIRLKFLLVFLLLTACGGKVKTNLACEGEAKESWFDEGYKTAMEAKPIRTFDKYKNQCGEAITKEQRASFIDGYTKGALEFCTYENGFEIGKTNKEFPQVCPFEIRGKFLEGYKRGQIAYNDKIKRMEKNQRDAEQAAERIDNLAADELGRINGQ